MGYQVSKGGIRNWSTLWLSLRTLEAFLELLWQPTNWDIFKFHTGTLQQSFVHLTIQAKPGMAGLKKQNCMKMFASFETTAMPSLEMTG